MSEQIRFYVSNDLLRDTSFNNGAITFVPETDNLHNEDNSNAPLETLGTTDLYFTYGGRHYQVKPKYTLSDIIGGEEQIQNWIKNEILEGSTLALAGYVKLDKIESDTTTTLDISIADGYVTNDGAFVTTEEIMPSSIENPGTFMVGNKVIPIRGVFDDVANENLNAITTNEYASLYPTSTWVDLTEETISNG